MRAKTDLWLLHVWYHAPFEGFSDQLEVQEELIKRGYVFDSGGRVVEVPKGSVVSACVNTLLGCRGES